MRAWALCSLTLLVAAFVPLASPAAASPSEAPLQIDVDETIDGADTYVFSVRIQKEDLSHFTIAADSHFTVQGHYDLNQSKQHATGLRGVLQYHSGVDCVPRGSNQPDPCFMDASGVAIEDAWDTRLEADGFTFENDPDAWAWASATGGIWWDTDRRFEVPVGADQLTIRFLLSIPDAQRIDVDVHIHSPQPITVSSVAVSDGGFAAHGDDFDPSLRADTAAAGAMVAGQETVDVDDDRLYAAFGPSWQGVTAAGNIAGQHNTAAASNIAYESPTGQRTSGTALAAGSWSGILVPGSEETGPHTFDVNAHAGVGPQNIYLIGYQGPNA